MNRWTSGIGITLLAAAAAIAVHHWTSRRARLAVDREPVGAAHEMVIPSAAKPEDFAELPPANAAVTKPAPDRWTIAGKVVSEDGAPVRGAEAVLRLDGREILARVLTNVDGAFLLAGAPPENGVQVELSAAGRAQRIARAILLPSIEAGDEEARIDLGEVVLGAACTITVVLRGPGGSPVAGAKVAIQLELTIRGIPAGDFEELSRAVPESDGTGTYRLHFLPAGRHRLQVEAEGLVPVWNLEVKLPAQGPMVIDLDSGGRIAGTVVGPDRKPLAGAKIAARDVTVGRPFVREAVTARDGRFEVGALPDMELTVQAAADGFVAREVDSVPAGTLDLVLELGPEAIVTGRVADSHGNPVSEASVSVGDLGGPTDADGQFSVAGLAGGTYRLKARHSGKGSLERESILVPAGERLDVGTLTLEPPADEPEKPAAAAPSIARGDVRGRVVGPEGRRVPDAEVSHGWIWDVRRWRCDPQGMFTIRSFPAGETVLAVKAEGYCRTVTEIRIEEGQSTHAEIILTPEARIAGQVVSAGVPFAGATVTARTEENPNKPVANCTSDDRGRFVLRGLEPGNYCVVGEIPRVVPRMKVGIDVEAGHEVDVGDLRLEAVPDAEISGTVMDEDGRPIGGARVYTYIESYDDQASALTDPDGRFRIGTLPPREHDLLVRRPGFWFSLRRVEAPAADVKLVLTKLHGLSGRVLDAASGLPVAGARVLIPGEQESSRPMRSSGHLDLKITDRQGRFVFDRNLRRPPIRYLTAEANGYAMGCATVPSEKEAGEVRLLLHRGTPLRATVLDAEGRSLEGADACLVEPGSSFHLGGFKSDDQGLIEFGLVRAGAHRLLLGHKEYGVEEFPLEMAAGAPAPVVRLTGSKPLTVAVRKADGSPSRRAELSIRDASGANAFDLNSIFRYGDGRIPEIAFDGYRSYHFLPAGRYWVQANERDVVTPEVEVVVGHEAAEVVLTFP